MRKPLIDIRLVTFRSEMSKYELVIYGASGFTGQFVIEYVARAGLEQDLTWAVAGRSEGRLKAALARAGAMLGSDLSRGETCLSCRPWLTFTGLVDIIIWLFSFLQ